MRTAALGSAQTGSCTATEGKLRLLSIVASLRDRMAAREFSFCGHRDRCSKFRCANMAVVESGDILFVLQTQHWFLRASFSVLPLYLLMNGDCASKDGDNMLIER